MSNGLPVDRELPRRVLLLGAAGFIGGAVLARFRREGVAVRAVARRAGQSFAGIEWHSGDLTKLLRADDWLPHLAGVDTVVNCAGVLQGGNARAVHVDSANALYDACERAGVPRVVLVSAVGVDRGAVSEFSATKRAGEDALTARALDWVILRPSLVVGRAAYGGSAFLRGLASLPVVPQLPDTGPVEVVHLDDLAATIVLSSRRNAPSRIALDVTGCERLELSAVLEEFRHWLRFRPAPRWRVPNWLAACGYRLGDFVRWLGWRSPLCSVAGGELTRGAAGDARRWVELTGIEPQPLRQILAQEPASVQERWFARLYFVKPLVLAVLAAFWIVTGLITVGGGWEQGLGYLRAGGVPDGIARVAAAAGALCDVAIGVGIAFRRTARFALLAAVGLSLFYVLAATAVLPRLWLDALGPLLKIGPIVVLHLVALAIVDDR